MIFVVYPDGIGNRHFATDNGSHVVANRLFRMQNADKLANRFDRMKQLCLDSDNRRIKRYHDYVLVCPD